MALIKPTVTSPSSDTQKVVWAAVTESDTAEAYDGLSEFADRSVQFTGTIGGATMTIQGANDKTNFATLNDPFAVAISLTAAGIRQVVEYTQSVKPVFSGGSSQSVTVTLVAKRK